jgi:Tfp pilus assembly protein PilP
MIILLCSLFMACDLEDFKFGNARVEQANNVNSQDNKPKSMDLPQEQEEENYSYNPNNKRDPFRSFLATGTDSSIIDNIPRTPLQKYEIGQYSLTAIIWGIDRPRALVEDPEGIGHVMEIGTYIGKKWGKVETIEEGVVVVTEELQTVDGQLVVKKHELRLEVSNTGL